MVSPQRLEPRFVERVWGSTNLSPLFPGERGRIGEVWFAGTDGLPLLVKFLFTTEKLSVQVHPGDSYARCQGHARGKTEMWHILAAQPGARIAAGFCESIDKSRLREAAASGEILDLLCWHEAHAGDTFYIPAGTVHAIGEGIVLCEIQQQSDVTYRLYDYGRPRELHLDCGVEVSDLGPANPRQEPRAGLLVDCDHFRTSRVALSGTLLHQPEPEYREMWVVLEGSAQLAGQTMRAGEVWQIPPTADPYELSGSACLLHVVE